VSQSRLVQLFEAAVELPAAERTAFLEAQCGGDAALRAQVEALLAADGAPAAAAFESLLAPATRLLAPGTLVRERYRIVAVRGEGGMGIVYDAEQLEPHRRVALKCLRPGSHAPASLQRFQREAELMGRLRHPGIAQIIEAGSIDDDGRQPFLAMEFVDGVPLLEALRDAPLTTRIEVIAEVAEAVQHAHAHGIVHRDLKPSNVLVEKVGERWRPKVLDFGIARALDDGDGLTRTHEIVGTLAYLAPEQFRGEPATPRVDVWALGVTAYQLLAGRAPFVLEGLPVSAAAQRLLQDEPTALARLVPALRGDVATIVHTALAKDPARRYADAGAFAADLRRLQANEPITARPPSALYRASRFARRHRGPVVGAALAFVALATGLVFAWRAADRELQQRVAAESLAGELQRTVASEQALRRDAESLATDLRALVGDVVFQTDLQLAQLPAATAARRTLVEAGMRYVDKLLERGTRDPELYYEAAAALHKLALVRGMPGRSNLGDLDGAERAMRRALELLEQARGLGHDRPALRTSIGMITRDLAKLLETRGRAREGLALLQGLAAVASEQERLHGVAAGEQLRDDTVSSLAHFHLVAGERGEALVAFERHRQNLERGLAAGDASSARALSATEEQIAWIVGQNGDHARADALFASAIAHAEAAFASKAPLDRERLATALQSFANWHLARGRPAAAKPLLLRALELLRDPAAADPDDVQAGRVTLLVEHTLADLHLREGEPAAAAPFAQAVLQRATALRQKAPLLQALLSDEAKGRELLARIAALAGDGAVVERELAAAIALLEQRFRGQDGVRERSDLAQMHATRAELRCEVGNVAGDDRERGRLYAAAADDLVVMLELLRPLAEAGKLPPYMRANHAQATAQLEQLRATAAELRR
jgi:predicted Ser/Thr protein kinase